MLKDKNLNSLNASNLNSLNIKTITKLEIPSSIEFPQNPVVGQLFLYLDNSPILLFIYKDNTGWNPFVPVSP